MMCIGHRPLVGRTGSKELALMEDRSLLGNREPSRVIQEEIMSKW